MFIGPPFNALPLSHLIDYSDVGMVFNITGPTPWIELYEPKILELPTDASASSFSKPLKIIQVGAKLLDHASILAAANVGACSTWSSLDQCRLVMSREQLVLDGIM